MNDLISALSISLNVSITSTVICAFIGIPLGYLLAINEFKGKHSLLGLLNTLLALPTVVIGLLVYSLICRGSFLGNLGLLFTPLAIILGQVVLAFPIMVSYTHTTLITIEKDVRETAFTLGASNFETFITLVLEARFGIFVAVAATFGRLIGEVGISMMLGGNIANYTRTMTTTIALETSKGEFILGLKLGGILLIIALAVNMCLNYLRRKAY